MQASSQFAVAVHALALSLVAQAEQSGRLIASDEIAAMVGSHPVHVRRVLGVLREAGLVQSHPGPGGGWQLARPAEEITLYDVLAAVVPESTLVMPSREPDGCCWYAPNLPVVLERYLREARSAVEERLSQISLTQVIAEARPVIPHCPGLAVDSGTDLAMI